MTLMLRRYVCWCLASLAGFSDMAPRHRTERTGEHTCVITLSELFGSHGRPRGQTPSTFGVF